ncbi:hypothetical protein HMY34_01435 [Thiothrix subterranea]|uniref:hypothetical protein n=1 Tax=Thiothrix subterranea TaxID=2735563 RepID=UPI00192C2F23|nr:hypothetical protein [Thiothrix subterranea]QQZ27525.1 hypothetical protein HMY34_01435 [Thiothrix subterranea]
MFFKMIEVFQFLLKALFLIASLFIADGIKIGFRENNKKRIFFLALLYVFIAWIVLLDGFPLVDLLLKYV